MRQTMAAYRNHRQCKAPWKQRLKQSLSMNPVRVWV
jgi:hypothetical protein